MNHTPLPHAPLLTALLLTALAGCGGSGTSSGSTTLSVPELSSDFSSFAPGGQSFSSTARTVQVAGLAAGAGSQTIAVRAADDGSSDIILTADGTDIRLSPDPATGTYLGQSNGQTIAAEAALSQHAGLLLLVEDGGFAQSGAFHVFGTESVDVGAQSGSAFYIGPSTYLATTEGGFVNAGAGGFVFEVSFDSAEVDGLFTLQDTTGTQFTLVFEDAAVTSTGFSSDTIVQQGLNGTLSGASLDATFYGPNAQQLGGTYSFDINSGGVQDAFFAGGFLGDRQSQAAIDALASGEPAQTSTGETIVLGPGGVVGGSGSVYPDGSSSYYNSTTDVSFGSDGSGCYYSGD